MNKYAIPIVLLTIIFTASDQVSKKLVMDTGVFTKNTGIAFGIPIPPVILMTITLILMGVIVWFAFKEFKMRSRLTQLSLALILGGAIGNYIDRLAHGFVIDFISLDFGFFKYPDFNLADIYIVAGVLMILGFYGKIIGGKTK